jgi:hypothetical protein
MALRVEEEPLQRQPRMARYKFIKRLGNGAHGSVKLYRNAITGKLVSAPTRTIPAAA